MLPTLQQPIWNQTRPSLHFSLALHSPNKQNKQRNKRAFLLLLFVLHPEFVKTRHRDINNHNKSQEKNIQTSILKYSIKASLQWVFLQLISFTALWVHKRLPSTVSMQRISAAIFLRCDKAFFCLFALKPQPATDATHSCFDKDQEEPLLILFSSRSLLTSQDYSPCAFSSGRSILS